MPGNSSNSTGNTISNLFSEISENDEVANIYCRNEAINNTICKRYFKVTENDILIMCSQQIYAVML